MQSSNKHFLLRFFQTFPSRISPSIFRLHEFLSHELKRFHVVSVKVLLYARSFSSFFLSRACLFLYVSHRFFRLINSNKKIKRKKAKQEPNNYNQSIRSKNLLIDLKKSCLKLSIGVLDNFIIVKYFFNFRISFVYSRRSKAFVSYGLF